MYLILLATLKNHTFQINSDIFLFDKYESNFRSDGVDGEKSPGLMKEDFHDEGKKNERTSHERGSGRNNSSFILIAAQ